MMTKVLITGGLGYVGGRVIAALSKFPDLYLRIGTHRKGARKPECIERGELVSLNLSSDDEVHSVCKDIDCVIHLAALNENESAADPERAFLVNSLGTLKLLRASEKAGVRRFIYVSTAHVYGAPLEGMITECTLARPIHPYAITHRAAEDFVLAAHDKGVIEGVVLRLSNSFGSPADNYADRWTLLVNDLCRQAVTSKTMVLRSSGLQQRDFITLTDVENAMNHFLRLPSSTMGNGLFNLGGECSLRIIDIANMIVLRCGEVLGFCPTITKPAPVLGETSPILNYRIEKLKTTGFNLIGKIDEEIDGTLLFCMRAFGGTAHE